MQEHVDPKVNNTSKILTSLLAGAIAGGVAKTVIAPLDRTKINFQVSNSRFSMRAAMAFLVRSWRQDGVRSLWRGNSATMVRILPYAAIQYMSHEQWKHVLGATDAAPHLSPGRRYLAGSLAGVTSVTATYPLDVVRARMAVTKRCLYENLLQATLLTYREGGVKTLYRGFAPTILGVVPYAGTSFFTYETLKQHHRDLWPGAEDSAISPIHRMCYGALAGACGQISAYPLDIVRRRMQTAGCTGHEEDYRSIVGTLTKVFREEGLVRGLYKGLSMNWIKGPIAVGVSFTTYETIRHYLRLLPVFRDNDEQQQRQQ